jgi:uncharacterized protein YecT (DUF1311 family)
MAEEIKRYDKFQELRVNMKVVEILPTLQEDEKEMLKKSVKDEGIRDALVIWKETGELIDGIHRYERCKKLQIGYPYIEKGFASLEEVIAWVILNQLGRRNLDKKQRAKLALALKPKIETEAKKKQIEEGKHLGGDPTLSKKSTEGSIDTRKKLAEVAEVSEDTIRKTEIIEEQGSTEIKEALDRKKISLNKAYKKTIKESNKESNKESKKLEQKEDGFIKFRDRLLNIVKTIDNLPSKPFKKEMTKEEKKELRKIAKSIILQINRKLKRVAGFKLT